MKYLCLVYSEEQKLATMSDDECMEYDAALRKSGHCLASEPLQPEQLSDRSAPLLVRWVVP